MATKHASIVTVSPVATVAAMVSTAAINLSITDATAKHAADDTND